MMFAADLDGSAAEVALRCTGIDLLITNLDLTPEPPPLPVEGCMAAKR